MDATDSFEYGEWYKHNRHRLMKFAWKLGFKGEAAQDAVSNAVRATLEPTSVFPRDKPELWLSWHYSTLRGHAHNAAVSRARQRNPKPRGRPSRAAKARQFASIQSRAVPWTQVVACKKMKRQERRVWPRWGKGEAFIDRVQRSITDRHGELYPPRAWEPPMKCRCGMALTRRREKEGKTAVFVLGCINGHRQYGEVQS